MQTEDVLPGGRRLRHPTMDPEMMIPMGVASGDDELELDDEDMEEVIDDGSGGVVVVPRDNQMRFLSSTGGNEGIHHQPHNPTLRNRHLHKTFSTATISEAEIRSYNNPDSSSAQRRSKYPFRQPAGYPNRHQNRAYYGRSGSNGGDGRRTRQSSSGISRSPKVIQALKKSLKLGKIRDINIIDRFSRVIFPTSFVVFNICYWCFYIL